MRVPELSTRESNQLINTHTRTRTQSEEEEGGEGKRKGTCCVASRETKCRQYAFSQWSDVADPIRHRFLSSDVARAKGRTLDRGRLGEKTTPGRR